MRGVVQNPFFDNEALLILDIGISFMQTIATKILIKKISEKMNNEEIPEYKIFPHTQNEKYSILRNHLAALEGTRVASRRLCKETFKFKCCMPVMLIGHDFWGCYHKALPLELHTFGESWSPLTKCRLAEIRCVYSQYFVLHVKVHIH